MVKEKGSDPHNYTTRELYNEFGPKQIQRTLLARSLTSEDLARFGNCDSADDTSLELKIFEAAETLKQRCIHDFSTSVLAILLFHDSWNPKTARSYKGRVIRRISAMFRDEAKHKSEKYCMEIPHIQILRETTGNYSGNLYEAREHWSKFSPSDLDFQRSVRLPVPLPNQEGIRFSEEAAFVLGAIYAAGYLARKNKESQDPYRVIIRGDKGDLEFFQKHLHVLIGSVFNLSNLCSRETRPTADRNSTYIMPSFKIDSLAIATWLRYDLGFPAGGTRNENKRFPEVCLREHDYIPFLSGFVSLKGTKHKQRGAIRFVSRDQGLLLQISRQLQRAGLPVSRIYDSASPFIEVVKSNVPALLSKLSIRNPKLMQ
jgi:hypothetical protein